MTANYSIDYNFYKDWKASDKSVKEMVLNPFLWNYYPIICIIGFFFHKKHWQDSKSYVSTVFLLDSESNVLLKCTNVLIYCRPVIPEQTTIQPQ